MIINLFKLASFTFGFFAFWIFVGVVESVSFADFALRIGYGVIFSAVAYVLNKIGG